MTGFGSAEGALDGDRITVDARSVNARYLEVRVRCPHELAEHVGVIEETARGVLVRGRVEVVLRVDSTTTDVPVLGREKARAALEQLRALRDEVAPGEAVPMSLLASVPDLFTRRALPPAELARETLSRLTQRACAALMEMRAREGTVLAADLLGRIEIIRDRLGRTRERVPSAVNAYRERLQDRIEKLLRGGSVAVDPERIEHEVVMFADRTDMTEEFTRLGSHLEQFVQESRAQAVGVGRKLEFLLQEMGRETNTIGSKNADIEIARAVIEIKTELERVREQVQNVL